MYIYIYIYIYTLFIYVYMYVYIYIYIYIYIHVYIHIYIYIYTYILAAWLPSCPPRVRCWRSTVLKTHRYYLPQTNLSRALILFEISDGTTSTVFCQLFIVSLLSPLRALPRRASCCTLASRRLASSRLASCRVVLSYCAMFHGAGPHCICIQRT